jgi:hypothetical protein
MGTTWKVFANGRYAIFVIWTSAVIAAIIGIILVLDPLSWYIAGNSVRKLHGADQADAINAVRQTVLTTLGGAAALVALGFTVRTYYLSRRGQVTDRFSTAIAQLASDKLEERLGGIHALEHVMAESPTDHIAVVGVLSAFIRSRTMLKKSTERRKVLGRAAGRNKPPPFGTEPDADIDAALIALARRPDRDEPNRPDLRNCSLVGISVRAYDFTRPPRLTRVFFTCSDLRRADLRGANLRGTIATEADLRWALLGNANLSHTELSRVRFNGAYIRGANLAEARLSGADLRDVDGLAAEQLSFAFIDDSTLLDRKLAGDPWVKARIAACMALPEGAGPWACPRQTPRP